MTDTQWDAAYNAAVKSRDITEVQRLRDLHFRLKAPNTPVVDVNGNPQLVYHKTPNEFTEFDNSRSIGNLNWFATPNAYGENGVLATGAGKNPSTMKLYINMKNPHKPTIDEGMEPAYINEGEDGILGIIDKDMTNYFPSSNEAGEGFMMSGGVDNPFALKSAEAITRDDAGNIIPLSMRDNFSVKDIRYVRDPSSYQAPYLHNGRQGLRPEDFTDFDTMVSRMNSTVEYSGTNPFKDGKMTGFRKWALDNGASPSEILRVEKELSGNNWSKLRREFSLTESPSEHSAYIPQKDKIQINMMESDFNQVFPHEVEHRLFYKLFGNNRNSVTAREVSDAFLPNSPITRPDVNGDYYYFDHNYEELLNRFTQIKNALGIKEFRALTAEELKRAYRMFKNGSTKFAQGTKQNLEDFFDSIKSWDAAAKLSGKALIGIGVVYTGANVVNNGNTEQ